MEKILKRLLPVMDIFAAVLVFPAALLLKLVRCVGVERLPCCKGVLMAVGVFPIRRHYYEPKFDGWANDQRNAGQRNLSAIDWNIPGQLALLDRFLYGHELKAFPQEKSAPLCFYFNNEMYASGDAEYWYQIIRALKPRRIYEIGSGFSTLLAIAAIVRNRQEDEAYQCEHVCIEPYESPWLETAGVVVLRKRVEEVDVSFFAKLEENDVLFIDSSHMIKPGGDVLFEYFNILPSLNLGVIVHVHDIFSPKDYPDHWLKGKVLFWNEQYLLEAFLSNNDSWEIIGALNYLHHNHYDNLKAVAPFLTPDREPGSFYIKKTS